MAMFQPATAPMSIKQLWRKGVDLTHACLSRLYLWALLSEILLILFLPFTNKLESEHVTARGLTIDLVGILIAQVLFLFMNGFFLHQINVLMQGKSATLKQSAQLTLKKLFRLFIASVLYLLLIFAGFIFFMLPGVYLSLTLAFYLPAIMLDDASSIGAIKTSLKLVWGHWWRTWCVMLLPIIGGIILSLVSLPPGFSSSIFSVAAQGKATLGQYLFDIILCLLQAYITLLVLSFVLVQWYDLKLRKPNAAQPLAVEAVGLK